MKNTALYIFSLFITLLFLGCVPSIQKDEKDNPSNKFESKELFKYFTDKTGQEISSYSNDYFITLPKCFETGYNTTISLTGQFTFLCSENSTYFTIDRITPEDITYYRDYFENKKKGTESDIHILRDYVMDIRAVGLVNAQKSVHSTLKTHKGKEMLLGAVIGQSYSNANELSYQYGVVAIDDGYYVLQAVTSTDNYKYLRQDILQIFKSFRVK